MINCLCSAKRLFSLGSRLVGDWEDKVARFDPGFYEHPADSDIMGTSKFSIQLASLPNNTAVIKKPGNVITVFPSALHAKFTDSQAYATSSRPNPSASQHILLIDGRALLLHVFTLQLHMHNLPLYRVLLDPRIYCGSCVQCEAERYSDCAEYSFCGLPPRDGFLTQYVVHPADFCYNTRNIPETAFWFERGKYKVVRMPTFKGEIEEFLVELGGIDDIITLRRDNEKSEAHFRKVTYIFPGALDHSHLPVAGPPLERCDWRFSEARVGSLFVERMAVSSAKEAKSVAGYSGMSDVQEAVVDNALTLLNGAVGISETKLMVWQLLLRPLGVVGHVEGLIEVVELVVRVALAEAGLADVAVGVDVTALGVVEAAEDSVEQTVSALSLPLIDMYICISYLEGRLFVPLVICRAQEHASNLEHGYDGTDMIPDDMSIMEACTIPTIARCYIMYKEAAINQETNLLVFGGGILGLTMISIAKRLGVNKIFAADPSRERLIMCKDCGADFLLNVRPYVEPKQLEPLIRAAFGKPVDVTFCSSVTSNIFENAIYVRMLSSIIENGRKSPSKGIAKPEALTPLPYLTKVGGIIILAGLNVQPLYCDFTLLTEKQLIIMGNQDAGDKLETTLKIMKRKILKFHNLTPLSFPIYLTPDAFSAHGHDIPMFPLVYVRCNHYVR
ncbi:hypothetical protein AAG570_010785 [Ranatra chinensis]|uniref:Alcohol dehydrogenase-like C-terminal domain-containing protein n=1 Tax=Ranatra chinensis TaxID=642074 RepID=A0ABD0Z9M2_9HEMI